MLKKDLKALDILLTNFSHEKNIVFQILSSIQGEINLRESLLD